MTTTQTSLAFGTGLYKRGTGWAQNLPKHLNSQRTLVVAFGSAALQPDERAFHDLRAAFPDSIITGCSTSGEIHGDRLLDDSLSVGVYRFRQANVRAAKASVRTPADSLRAGELIAEQLAGPELRSVQVYSDGLNINGTELVRGLTSRIGPDVVVSGGLAGDGTAFKKTWTIHAGHPVERTVAAVGLYGPTVRVGHGSKGGWDAFGPERLVTKSAGNVLYELDGQPALSLYKKYLGERAAGLPSSALLFPLAIRADRGSAQVLVRTILAVDESAESLTFAGDIPRGSHAQLMRANFERLIAGAAESALTTGSSGSGTPCLCIAVSCIGRRLVLGERTEEELGAVAAALAPGSLQVGFYSYGEISPSASGSCDLHNQTMTLTTISEG